MIIDKILDKKINKERQTVYRMQFKLAEMQKILDDVKSGRITKSEFTAKYYEIEQRWK